MIIPEIMFKFQEKYAYLSPYVQIYQNKYQCQIQINAIIDAC